MSPHDERLGNTEWVDNWTVGTGLRFELMELATQRVFICQAEVATDELASFEAPEGFRLALAGEARADLAFFARSPGAGTDGPVTTVDLGGRTFAFVARPVGFQTLGSGAMEMSVDKHHALLYKAGRDLDVLDFGDGTVATAAWGSVDPEVALTGANLEDGWRLRRVRLGTDLLTFIPNPARVIVLDNAFGFHGPVATEVVDAAVDSAAGASTIEAATIGRVDT